MEDTDTDTIDGLPILKKSTPTTEDGLPILKKKDASVPTSPNLGRGIPTAQDLTAKSPIPLSPQGVDEQTKQDEAKERARQERVDAANEKLRSNLSKLSPDERETIHKVNELANNKPSDNLREPSEQELKHAEFMENHPVVRALNYMGSQASHGAVQVLKGAAHEMNKAFDPNRSDAFDYMLFDPIEKAADLGLTKTDIAKSEANKPTAAAGMFANFAPAIAGGAALDAPKAMMFLQGVGQGKELAEKMDINNPLAKEALIQGTGAVNLLMSDIGDGIFGKLSSSLKGKVASGVAMDAIKEAAEKGTPLTEALQTGVKELADKWKRAPLDAAEHYINTLNTFAKVNVGNFAVHKAVDVLNDKPVFNETPGNLAENLYKSVTQDAPAFAALPAAMELTKLTPFSNYKNDVIEGLAKDPNSSEDIKQQVAEHGGQEGWTPEQIQATNDHVDKIAQASKSLPPDMPIAKKAKGMDLVVNRTDLEQQLQKEQAGRENLDPSIADIPSKQEEFLMDKINQANDKIRSLVTGKRTTYSNPEEGEYFKTTDGKQEPITENRYKLENLERPLKSEENEREKTEGSPSENQTEGKGSEVEQQPADSSGKESPTTQKENGEGNVKQGGEEPPLKEQDNAVQKQSTGEVGVREQEVVGETVGGRNAEPKETPEQGKETQKEKVDETATTKENGNAEGKANGEKDAESSARQQRVGGTESKYEKDLTGIRNEDVEKERGEAVPREKKTLADVDKEGKKMVDSGRVDPDKLAEKIVKGKKVATEEEQAALRYHKTKLKNRQRELLRDSETNPENSSENHIEYERTADLLEQNRSATEEIGRRAGIILRDRQEVLAQDYSRVHILQRAKQANSGESLSTDLEKELEERTKRIEELEGKLADAEARVSKVEEQNTVNKVGESQRRTRKEVTRAKLREERQELLADLHTIARKAMGSAGANKIPVEMIAPLTKLAINYVADGVTSLSIVVDRVYDDLKDHITGLSKDDVRDIIKDGFDKHVAEENKVRLEKAKKRQLTKLEALKQQSETGDIETRTNRKLAVDNDYLTIRADIKREQTLINKRIAAIADSKKEIGRKTIDFAVKWGRWAKLASITVLGKLAAAGLTTLSVKIPEEIVGAGLSKLLPRIAKKAEFEGGMNLKTLGKSYAKAAFQGMKDAADEMNFKKGGQSDLSALYGKDVKGRLPAEAADFWGHLHSAIKAPFKRAIWEYSYAKRFESAARKGLDPLDPVVDATNRLNAYKDGERAIFMGDNKISSAYEAAMRTLENSNSSSAKNIAALTRILLPFVKVPTNIALEGARYAGGLIPGLGKLGQIGLSTAAKAAGAEKLAYFFHKGMGELTPEESEIVLNNLKKGSVGGAAVALGFFNPHNFGGFYQPGEHRKKGDVEEGSIKIFGENVPKWMNEHPIFLAMQIGASFRRVLDAHRHKQDDVEAASLAVASGLASHIPLANGADEILGALHGTGKFDQLIGNQLKGEIEPALIQQLATITDTKDKSMFSLNPKNQQKRAPDKKHGLLKYVKQDLETGIPGLRQQVKKKQ